MVDFKKLRDIKTPSMTLSLEIELSDSFLTVDEATEALQREINNSNSKAFSEFIVTLLRVTKASTWGIKKAEVK